MPSTPVYVLPYPSLTDTADVPRDIQALATKLDTFPGIGVARPPAVTSLPASPVDGQECYYVADATAGVLWHLRYRAASASPYKWEFVGGSNLVSGVVGASGVTGTGSAYGDLAGGAGPDVTVPLTGDYEATWEAEAYNSGSGVVNLSVGLTGTGGAGSQPVLTSGMGSYGQNGIGATAGYGVLPAVPAGIIRMKYLYTGLSTIVYLGRRFSVHPRRVG